MFRNEAMNSLGNVKLKQITAGSDEIIKKDGKIFLKSSNLELVQNKELSMQAKLKLIIAMSLKL